MFGHFGHCLEWEKLNDQNRAFFRLQNYSDINFLILFLKSINFVHLYDFQRVKIQFLRVES